MYYVHKDYLGSISAITDATGNLIESLSYDACSVKLGFCEHSETKALVEPISLHAMQREGRRRKATNWTDYNVTSTLFDRGYTGHEHLPHFGLINMNGRVYDPFLGYSYAWNNPLKYTDPSGYYIDDNRGYTPAHIYLDSGGSSGSWLSGNQMYMTGGFGPGQALE